VCPRTFYSNQISMSVIRTIIIFVSRPRRKLLKLTVPHISSGVFNRSIVTSRRKLYTGQQTMHSRGGLDRFSRIHGKTFVVNTVVFRRRRNYWTRIKQSSLITCVPRGTDDKIKRKNAICNRRATRVIFGSRFNSFRAVSRQPERYVTRLRRANAEHVSYAETDTLSYVIVSFGTRFYFLFRVSRTYFDFRLWERFPAEYET